MLSEYIISLPDVSFHIVAYMYARFQYLGKNPMRFAVFGRISVQFCGFRTPLTPPSCNLCDAGYVGYTCGHLHERVDGHKQKSSSICKNYLSEHKSDVPPFLSEQFHVLTKGSNKFDCLIKEMLFIRKLKPSLNVQADSIRAKVFTWRICDPLLLC